jgi:FkbM family methyltransferase
MPHYHFIEIGTSDFATLVKSATPETVGISVEPLRHLLESLPNPPNVKKVCAAVSNEAGTGRMFYVPEAARVEHNLPSWVKGCGMLGSPHPAVERYLRKHGVPTTIIKEEVIPVIGLKELFVSNEVTSVDYVKIDVEGHDYILMKELCDLIEEGLHVKHVKFESNYLTKKEQVLEIATRLEARGYSLRRTQTDTYASLL